MKYPEKHTFYILGSFLLMALTACRNRSNPDAGNTEALHSTVWVADNGDGTYKNPVIHADYSDPDVVRVGDDFYMTSSSFTCVPGLPVLHSHDLVNWKLIGHALIKQHSP